MENLLLDESEVLAAFKLLFALDMPGSRAILHSVKRSEIKTAYRKRAMQTHPDLFATYGEEYQRRCSERFVAVNNAYELLNNYMELKDKGFHFRQAQPAADRAAAHQQYRGRGRPQANPFHERARETFGQFFWNRDVPGRALRFGEFLYYSGMIPWRSLIMALVWQGKQRPRLGEIAQRWRWLTEFQVKSLLMERHPGERIGELLMHNGIISPFQLNLLLWHQRRIQRPIGEYFVRQSLLSEREIQAVLRRQQEHNFRFRTDRFR